MLHLLGAAKGGGACAQKGEVTRGDSRYREGAIALEMKRNGMLCGVSWDDGGPEKYPYAEE